EARAVPAEDLSRLAADPELPRGAPPDAAQADVGGQGHLPPRLVPPGVHRPARAYGPDLILAAPEGVEGAVPHHREALPVAVHVPTDLGAGKPERVAAVPDGMGREGEGLALELLPATFLEAEDLFLLHRPDR